MVCTLGRRNSYQHSGCALADNPGLTLTQKLLAVTIDAAYELPQNDVAGSLDPTQFTDLILLDRDPSIIAPEEIARIKVLEAVDGVLGHRILKGCRSRGQVIRDM
jgi:predicted amidohydrolase YtcJ